MQPAFQKTLGKISLARAEEGKEIAIGKQTKVGYPLQISPKKTKRARKLAVLSVHIFLRLFSPFVRCYWAPTMFCSPAGSGGGEILRPNTWKECLEPHSCTLWLCW